MTPPAKAVLWVDDEAEMLEAHRIFLQDKGYDVEMARNSEDALELLRRRRGSPLVLDEALAILDAICRGVQAVHSAGAVHGDLKPANVLLGDANRVVVSDFGAARTIRDQHASSEAVHGTPAYLAPELARLVLGDVGMPWNWEYDWYSR